MKKIKNFLALAIKGILYIYTPLIILLFLIYRFFFTSKGADSAYNFIIYGVYALLVGFSYASNYSPKSIEKNLKNFTHVKKVLAKGKWEIVKESTNTMIVKPTFDFPFRLLIDNRVHLEYKDQKVNINGPKYYTDNLLR
ncbi:MAG TPA: hypothetical protein VFD08_00290, partial [Clostridia bacterium]|nr:hypothetical protein [Clostridia bacterium]